MINAMKPILAVFGFVAAAALFVLSDAALAHPDARTTQILEAIDTLTGGPAANFTKKGAPKVTAIEAIAGIDISAAERNDAWQQYEAWKADLDARTAAAAEAERLRSELATAADRNRRLTERNASLTGDIMQLRMEAASARGTANRLQDTLRNVEAKYKALSTGGVPCETQIAVVEADDSWPRIVAAPEDGQARGVLAGRRMTECRL